ncbi:hypothetical protein L8P27_05205 [Enterobacter asburiae]|uniref:hypothetical protein n=1 Tax=Enterobacter asburiae TaxID=61645 RepID=UPI002005E476|nr:hypothetical protein [Enterobacter asburiae]MCK7227250.1 hypothetical protein [Enterobacter asburiae]
MNDKQKNSADEAYNDSRERIYRLQMKSDSISIVLNKLERKQAQQTKKSENKEQASLSLKMTKHVASLLSLTKEECHQASMAELIQKLKKEKNFSDALAQQILDEIITLTDNLLQLSTGK